MLYTRGPALRRIEFTPQAPSRPQGDHPALGALQYWLRHGVLPDADDSWSIDPAGTAFQHRVWSAMREIPAGETRSYGSLAREVNSGARAVANACRHNPLPIVIPCHRVVARHGLGGFSGQTAGPAISRKVWMLRHEGGLPAR